jgi:hypothetical protein
MVTCRLKRHPKRSDTIGRTFRRKRWRVANANQCGDAGFAADIDRAVSRDGEMSGETP